MKYKIVMIVVLFVLWLSGCNNVTSVERQKVMTGIEVKGYLTEYYTDETFSDSDIGTLYSVYSDGSEETEKIAAANISRPDLSTYNESETVTISYKGFLTSYVIKVKNLIVNDISIKQNPKLDFVIDDDFTAEGMTVNVILYKNGIQSCSKIVDIDDVHLTIDSSRYDKNKIGIYQIIVTYELEELNSKSIKYNVTVNKDEQ